MALKDQDMHVVAAFGTLVLAGLLALPTVVLANHGKGDDDPKIDEFQAIEATVAYRSTPKTAQPQKPMNAPPPDVKDTVSHDADAKPVKKDKPDPPDPKDPPKSVDDQLSQFHHASDDDDQVGKPVTAPGAFDGNERGFGDETKGDPYFGQLSADLHNAWEFPQILNASGTPVGCVHLTLEGKIAEVKLWTQSGNSEFDESVTLALKKVQKAREDAPVAVPKNLETKITKWICFRFNSPTAAAAPAPAP